MPEVSLPEMNLIRSALLILYQLIKYRQADTRTEHTLHDEMIGV